MKRFLAIILVALTLQSCSLLQMGIDFHQQQPVEHFNLMTGYCSPTYYYHNSTEGYSSPVSPVHIAINIDKQPSWGPAGYDCAAFYYMPELNVYYDINGSMFHYPAGDGRSWIAAKYLPSAHCDLYRTYKVVLNYSSPWMHNRHHLEQFHHYVFERTKQTTIRDSRDPKYSVSRHNNRPWLDPNQHHTPSGHY